MRFLTIAVALIVSALVVSAAPHGHLEQKQVRIAAGTGGRVVQRKAVQAQAVTHKVTQVTTRVVTQVKQVHTQAVAQSAAQQRKGAAVKKRIIRRRKQ
uniref:Uncharacterized protein n=1 Tax=Anopheles dirus TaxID=7168 RepID=A0A182NY55_9DIPT